MFDNIVPCGIADKAVTSLAAEGVDVTMREVVDAVVRRSGSALSLEQLASASADQLAKPTERSVDVHEAAWRAPHESLAGGTGAAGTGNTSASRTGDTPASGTGDAAVAPVIIRSLDRRLATAGVDNTSGIAFHARKPEYLRAPVKLGTKVLELRSMVRGLDLVTVCEEAGCPNLSECWADGTATFMINGERCTRACGFCLVDTRHPLAARPGRARARRRRRRATRPGARRRDGGRPRRPRRRWSGRFRRHRGGDPPARARARPSRSSSPTARGRRLARHDLRQPARRAQPQHRDRPPPAAGRPHLRLLRAQPHGARPRQSCRARDEIRHDPRDGRDARRRSRRRSLDLRAVGVDIVTIGQYLRPSGGSPAGAALVAAARSSRRSGRWRGRWVSRTSSPHR